MSISFPLDLPTSPAPKSITLTQVTNVASLRNIFNLTTQKQVYGGQMWIAEVTLPLMERAQAELWNSFLISLNGPEGTFWLGDPTATSPQGSASGSPVVDGAGQVGGSLATTGWTPSITGILKAGDYIQVGNYLYKLKQDADSDGSGDAILEIWPNLRSPSPADASAIITESAKGLFQLAQNTNPLFSAGEDKLYDISFSAIEAI